MKRVFSISLIALLLAVPAFGALATRDEIRAGTHRDDSQAPRSQTTPGIRPLIAEGNHDWCRTIPTACPRHGHSLLAEVNDDRRDDTR